MRGKWTMWLTLALGAWLVVSPFILGYSDVNAAIVNNVAVGAVAIIISAVALFVRPVGRWAWLLVPVGAWQAIAPWTLGYADVNAAFVNAIIVGIAIAVLAVIGGLIGRTMIVGESRGIGDTRPADLRGEHDVRERDVHERPGSEKSRRDDERRRRRAA